MTAELYPYLFDPFSSSTLPILWQELLARVQLPYALGPIVLVKARTTTNHDYVGKATGVASHPG